MGVCFPSVSVNPSLWAGFGSSIGVNGPLDGERMGLANGFTERGVFEVGDVEGIVGVVGERGRVLSGREK